MIIELVLTMVTTTFSMNTDSSARDRMFRAFCRMVISCVKLLGPGGPNCSITVNIK